MTVESIVPVIGHIDHSFIVNSTVYIVLKCSWHFFFSILSYLTYLCS